MNYKRAMHASYCLEGSLYVFCGYSGSKNYLKSIERINYERKDKLWTIINYPHK